MGIDSSPGLDLSAVNRTQLSRATGIDMAHISRIFNRKSKPSLELALRIAGHLGITVEELCRALGIGLPESDHPGCWPQPLALAST